MLIRKLFPAFAAGLLAAWLAHAYLLGFTLQSYGAIDVVLSAESKGVLTFEIKNTVVHEDYVTRPRFAISYQAGDMQRLGTHLKDDRIRKFRIVVEPHQRLGIHQVRFASYFSNGLFLGPQALLANGRGENLEIVDAGQSIQLETGAVPGIFDYQQTLTNDNPLITILIPLVFGLMVGLLVLHWDWKESAIARDIARNQERPYHVPALDGLRAIAAFSVVGEHCWLWFTGVGGFGVWIFFALSGYLLIQPFVREPMRGLDPASLSLFARRRVLRIVPLYYCFLFVLYAADDRSLKLLEHLFFVRGDGHLWTLPNEMLFYFVVPLVFVFGALLGVRRRAVFAAVLCVSSLIAMVFARDVPIRLFTLGNVYPFWLGWFLVGCSVAVIAAVFSNKTLSDRSQQWIGWLVFAGLLFGLVSASATVVLVLTGAKLALAKEIAPVYGVLSGLLILGLVFSPRSWFSKLLGNPLFQWLGMIAFGVYLFHPLVLRWVDILSSEYGAGVLNGKYRLVLTTLITIPLASFTYTFIERPFLHLNKSPTQGGA